MKAAKLISVISLMLAIVLVFSACGSTTQIEILKEEDIIGSDGRFLYKIIYPAECDEDVTAESNNLRKQIAEAFDIKTVRDSDAIAKVEEGSYEILIGNTNREESKTALEYLKAQRVNNFDDWMIKVIGTKICVVAVDDAMLPTAVRYMNVTYCTNIVDFSNLGEGFEYINMTEYKGSGAKINGVNINDYKIIYTKEKSLLYAEKITQFMDVIEENYGFKLEQIRDDRFEEQANEILIGATNRKADDEIAPTGHDWIIKQTGTKLVINGGSNEAISAAMNALLELEEKAIENKEPLTIVKDFELKGTYSKTDGEYYLSWGDEFNEAELNRSIWRNYNVINGDTEGQTSMGGHLEKPGTKYVFMQNGDMVLPVWRVNKTDFIQNGGSTLDSLACQYGIIEIRSKFAEYPCPTQFWCASPSFRVDENGNYLKGSPGGTLELDIVESFGRKDGFATNVHCWPGGDGHFSLDGTKYANQKLFTMPEGEGNIYDDYHIYGCIWTPYRMAFSVDGDIFFDLDLTTYGKGGDFTRCPQRMQFGVSYASVNYGVQYIPDDAPAYTEARVDYWRIYQNDDYDNVMWVCPQPVTTK